MAITFEISDQSKRTRGRVGRVSTPHGEFDTPAFMTVGTRATVRGVTNEQLRQIGAQVVLNNAYHLWLRPGPDLIDRFGGTHEFMGWDGPILTDSGGYQAYSMADTNAIDEDGVTFKSIVDGRMLRMTPEVSMDIQNKIGADIIMAFDDCPPAIDLGEGPVSQTRLKLQAARDRDRKGGRYDHAARLKTANERTIRWLERCKAAHARPDRQALFGIVQGGTDEDARRWSAERVTNVELPGYAIGGVSVGETSEDIARIVRLAAPLLPEAKPRYLMGVGYPRDIVAAVCAGVDMFDCVLPGRNGRNANAFVPEGQIRLRNARFAEDHEPLEPGCDCPACSPSAGRPASRAYIRHLFMSQEMLGPILISLHNLRFYQRLMADLRATIASDDWASFADRWPSAAAGIPQDAYHAPRSGQADVGNS
ncbi:MAG: tRNA guanosine(34) transglycosylase Tgt [Phycisphaerales bacterium]|nr:tRNA guanosine(34) transglycosylase Tgt [Phycisphaerales bacterium]